MLPKHRLLSIHLTALLFAWLTALHAAEIHVATTGNDTNPGTQAAALRTIQHAADLAQAGDTITVHTGVYRERINPPRGGESDTKRITYQAASGEKVTITGSEPVKGWVKVQDDVWKVVIPNTFFGSFNPYSDVIHGAWFTSKGRDHHTGAVYLNGEWLTEAAKLDDVLKLAGATPFWFGAVADENTTIWAQFKGVNPNEQLVEINVRQTVFYPDKPGRNFIAVRGFILENGAPNWAPPTAEQKAIVGPHWSKGWVIENNIIRHSPCSGLSLGKYGDESDDKQGSAAGYNRVIALVLKNGWNRDTIGHHIIRNNEIYACEQAGIVGSMGCAFSIIEKNNIHDIHVRRLFSGAEQAGLKFHGAVDTVIRDNYFHHCNTGIHLDWMTQGTQVVGNLFHDNGGRSSSPDGKVGFFESGSSQDIFLEVNHGPMVVANNILLSSRSVFNASHGTLFAHNLMRQVTPTRERWLERKTPYHRPHSTELAGEYDNRGGDDRFLNNLFVSGASLAYFDGLAKLPVMMEGNVFTKGTVVSKYEKEPVIAENFDPQITLEAKNDGIYLSFEADRKWAEASRRLVSGSILGNAVASDLPYENPDGSPVKITDDYLGKARNVENPFPGPFEIANDGRQTFNVWPK